MDLVLIACSNLKKSGGVPDYTPSKQLEQAEELASLNMPFPEISDPKGICMDVSGLGRWGNGDVEVGLASMDELPYIMGLVRQLFERQMGNNNNGE